MWRRIVVAALALVATAAAQSAAGCSQRTAIVSVVARRGTPILGVTASDLRVSARRGTTVAAWRPVAGKVRAALLMDTSESMNPSTAQGREARAEALALARAAPPGRLALFTFDSSVWRRAGFGTPPAALLARIRSSHYGGATVLYDALFAVARVMRGAGAGASVVAVTDGRDDRSRYSAGRAAAEAAAGGIRLFLLEPGGAPSMAEVLGDESASRLNRRARERTLTQETGGLLLAPRRHFNHAARTLWAVIQHAYEARLRLPRPRAQPLHWKLRLTHAFLRAHPHARVFYPNPLPACGKPAKG